MRPTHQMTRAIILSVVLGALAIAFILPIALTLSSSFMTSAELNALYVKREAVMRIIPRRVSLDGYYKLLFESGLYLTTFWNSIVLALSITLGHTLVSLIVGFALAKVRFKGRSAVLFAYILVMMLPFQVTLLPNYILVNELKLYNTNWALILPGIFAPFGVFLLHQFLRSMPDDTLEAAALETGSSLRILFGIVLPGVYPAVLALMVLTFAESWNMIEQPMILLRDEWLYPLSLALNQQVGGEPRVIFAGAALYMTPVIFLYGIFEDELFTGLARAKF